MIITVISTVRASVIARFTDGNMHLDIGPMDENGRKLLAKKLITAAEQLLDGLEDKS